MQQLGSAILLHMLLTQNKEIEDSFHVFNRIVESLVGPVNSLDVNHLGISSFFFPFFFVCFAFCGIDMWSTGLLLDKIFKMKVFSLFFSSSFSFLLIFM